MNKSHDIKDEIYEQFSSLTPEEINRNLNSVLWELYQETGNLKCEEMRVALFLLKKEWEEGRE